MLIKVILNDENIMGLRINYEDSNAVMVIEL